MKTEESQESASTIELASHSLVDNGDSAFLCVLAFANYALVYTTNIVLARSLSVRDFDDYSVAVSTVMILSTLCTIGLEKYALKCLPTYLARRDWSAIHGFWVFSHRVIVGLGLCLSLVFAVLLETPLMILQAEYHLPIVIVALFLPVIGLFLFVVEVGSAYGQSLNCTFIYRLLCPLCFLAMVSICRIFGVTLNGLSAAFAYGLAWTFSLAAVYGVALRAIPRPVWDSGIIFRARSWLGESVPYLIHSFLLTILGHSGVIILEILYPSQEVVGKYAVAMQSATFIVLVATSTNRFYLPLVALFGERDDFAALEAMTAKRRQLVGSIGLVFIAAVVIGGRSLLGLFGDYFRDAYPTLCVLAVSATISTYFSLAPYYLQFMKRHGLVLKLTAFAVVLNLILCPLLASQFGIFGAATSYFLSMVGLYTAFQFVATKAFYRARQEHLSQ